MGLTDLLLRLRALASRRRAEEELDEELNFHLIMEARKKRLEGAPEAEARRTARVAFNGVERVREECRDVRGLGWLEDIGRDIRYGSRVLRKSPGFTTIAILSLAIGIGANTAVFTLVDRVLLRSLPVPEPDRLVVLKWVSNGKGRISSSNSRGDGHGLNVLTWDVFNKMRKQSRTMAAVFGFTDRRDANVAANGEARISAALLVTGNYFRGLGVSTLMGRPIVDDEDTANGLPAAVISYPFWERAFALDPGAIGKTIYVNREPCVVVGVTARGFRGATGSETTEVTLPIRMRQRLERDSRRPSPFAGSELFWVQTMGRLKPGVDARAAHAELSNLLIASLPESAIGDRSAGLPKLVMESGARGRGFLEADYKEPLVMLLAIVVAALLMTCANLAGLLLARATARGKEIAFRLAVGANRMRLLRQLVVEGALLSAIGGLAGLVLARWGLSALVAMEAAPAQLGLSPDARVLAFTAAVALVTTLLFALAPAIRATRVDVAHAMKDAQAISTGGAGLVPVRVLLAVQIAVALVLVGGAGLFGQTLTNLRAIPLGFNPQKLILFGIGPQANGYDEARGNQLYADVRARLKRIPGVTGVTLSSVTPVSGWMSNEYVQIEGDTKPRRLIDQLDIGPDYFETLQVPVIAGRSITERDIQGGTRVAVLNEAAARKFFPGGSPVGRRFRWPLRPELVVEIIGVARDSAYDRIEKDIPPVLYIPYTQASYGFLGSMNYEVRTAAEAGLTAGAIRSAIHEVDRMLPVEELKTMEAQIDEALGRQRLFASLVSVFGGITLVLACVGLYGSVAYSVTRRTREIGIRMALGARRTTVLRMVLGQVAITTAAGLAAGIPVMRALAKLVEAKFYGVKANDAPSMAAAALAVLLVAGLAVIVPARRATKIDPVRALRYD